MHTSMYTHRHALMHPCTHTHTPSTWTSNRTQCNDHAYWHTSHTHTNAHSLLERPITQAQSKFSCPHPFFLVKLRWSHPHFFRSGLWTSISSRNRFEGWNGFDVRIFLLGGYLMPEMHTDCTLTQQNERQVASPQKAIICLVYTTYKYTQQTQEQQTLSQLAFTETKENISFIRYLSP